MARRLRRRLAPAILVFQWLVCALHAHAQTAADRETARLLMDRGDEQVEQGDLEAALKLYLGAHEIMHVPTTGIEVARTCQALGKLVEARDFALEVLRMPVSPNEPHPFTVAREASVQLAAELETLIPVLSLEILPASATESVALVIDGTAIPKAAVSLPHALNPSAHRIHVSASGFYDVDQSVTLEGREHRVLRLELKPLPRALAGSANPPVSPSLQDRPVHAASRPSPWVWPMWAGVGVGGTGILVGSIAGIISLDRASLAKKYCEGNICASQAQPDRDASLRAARISNVGFGAAAVGAVVALGSWWMTTHVTSRSRVTAGIALSATPNTSMLRVYGEVW